MKLYVAFSFCQIVAILSIMISSSQLKTSQLAYLIWQLVQLVLFQKKSKQDGVEDILFVKNPGIGRFVILPLEIPYKTKLHPWNSTKSNCVIPLGNSKWYKQLGKAKNQDPWKFHMIYFLIIPGNSTPFLIDPWIFHILLPVLIIVGVILIFC